MSNETVTKLSFDSPEEFITLFNDTLFPYQFTGQNPFCAENKKNALLQSELARFANIMYDGNLVQLEEDFIESVCTKYNWAKPYYIRTKVKWYDGKVQKSKWFTNLQDQLVRVYLNEEIPNFTTADKKGDSAKHNHKLILLETIFGANDSLVRAYDKTLEQLQKEYSAAFNNPAVSDFVETICRWAEYQQEEIWALGETHPQSSIKIYQLDETL
jgi:hypothetical protein